MEQRRFGSSDLVCSALGFGTWELGTTQYGEIDVEEASRAIRAALDCGITLFDTAEAYGPYHSEEILGKALGARRREVVLVTKVGFEIDAEHKIVGRNASTDSVIAHTEGCLQRLGTDYIDLLLIHWPDHKTPIPETMGALERLKQDGKIRYYGVSNYTVEMMRTCEQHGHLTANQVGYNMYDRRMEHEVLPYLPGARDRFHGLWVPGLWPPHRCVHARDDLCRLGLARQGEGVWAAAL
ncbi:MAG TPA: aldo/keto reductase [Anaerolineae bacterium]|nr:aldo/keto reductase [Anaerolineae bacterium]